MACRKNIDEQDDVVEFTKTGLMQFINEKLGEKDSRIWKPRLTREFIKFAVKDPEPSS